ncbi:MAG TPA: hypothetical protein VG225_03800 [Terracidiphilus sp.]|jgi:hypothetical protein|nr:hypothetical protein [Terracidiphilus sp.]
MMLLHILLKDLRRHRWEILLFVAIVAAWAWQQTHRFYWLEVHAKELLVIVMFVLWFFLTIRGVQGESLVGDREFWPTRPYRTWQLFLAKAAFLVLCLNVPLFLAQLYLLAHAGIPLSPSLLPGLLFLQLEFAWCCTLPAAALAAVTDSIVQWVLSIVAMLIFGLAVSWLPWNSLSATFAGTEQLATWCGIIVIGLALLAALIWQYSHRRSGPARIVIAAAVVVVPLCIAFASTKLARLLAYTAPNGLPPVSLSLAPANQRTYTRTDGFGTATLQVPVYAASIPADTLVVIEGTRFHFTGNDGWDSKTAWATAAIVLSSQSSTAELSFPVPKSTADQIRRTHATIQAEIEMAVYHISAPYTIDTTPAHFKIPHVASCTLWSLESQIFRFSRLDCVAPLRMPDVYVTRLDSSENTCSQLNRQPRLPAGHWAMGVQYGSGIPADFDPNPIRTFDLDTGIGVWNPPIYTPQDPSTSRTASICRGTPVTAQYGWLSGRVHATYQLGPAGTESPTHPIEPSDDDSTPFSPRAT